LYLSANFPIQNCLKKGDALSPLLFNFALEYAIRKVQESQVGLKLNGTHQLTIYADDVNLLEDNIDTIQKNTQSVRFEAFTAVTMKYVVLWVVALCRIWVCSQLLTLVLRSRIIPS
jgi:hypothetical protein